MTGFIYFMRAGDFVKIGHSINPRRRLQHLTMASPHELGLEACHPGTKKDERALHQLLAAHRHKGEWFACCPQIDNIIKNGLPLFDHPTIESLPPGKARVSALIDFAVEIVGSQAKLGKLCKMSQQSIWQAKVSGKCSAELAIWIHHVTAGRVNRVDLCPDLPWPDAFHRERAAS